MSVAWDWMYKGVTSQGINKEISSTLECARLNRENLKQSLAIPETCILQMARVLVATHDRLRSNAKRSMISFQTQFDKKQGEGMSISLFDNVQSLRGIYSSLKYIVSTHQKSANSKKCLHSKKNRRVSIAATPNAWDNPELSPLDPYGSGDFFCKLCCC